MLDLSRKSWMLALISIALLNSGCAGLFKPKVTAPLPPVIAESQLNQSTVFDTINRNTESLRQLEADVRISMTGLPSSISGTLVLERPSNLRLTAGFLGVSDLGVDIGSNDELFWIWPKTSLPGQESSIKFARHSEFAASPAFQQIRLQPRWIIDALGLITFDSSDQHSGPYPHDSAAHVKFHSQLGQGAESITREVVVNKRYGWIEQVTLYDAKGARIAYANATDHQFVDQATVLPSFVQLNVFPVGSKPITMEFDLKRIKLNQLYVDPAQTWQMPSPEGVEQIDITRVPLANQIDSLSDVSQFNQPAELQPLIKERTGRRLLPRDRSSLLSR